MSYFTTKQIEEIAIAKVKEMVRKSGNRLIDTQLSENDKGPSWDGHIILYNKPNTMKKEYIEDTFPVQVKGTEVSRFSNKFHSFQVDVSDLENYLAGGIIYFVVEIIAPTEEVRVFYKVMNSMEIQLMLDEIEKSKGKEQKTKSIKIDSILNERTKFDRVCKDFKKYKDHHSLALVKNAIPLEKIDPTKLEILTFPELSEAINSTIYPFVRDEYNHLIPVKGRLKIEKIKQRIKNEFTINGEKYFDEGIYIKTEEGEYFSFGDTIHIYYDKEEVKVLESQKTIVERKRTIEFLINNLLPEELSEEETELVNMLKNELTLIKRIVNLCEKFNIDYKEIYTKDVLEKDLLAMAVLEKVTLPNEFIKVLSKRFNECKLLIIEFLNIKLLLFKAINDKDEVYINFYVKEFNLELSESEKSEELRISRFILLRKESILCNNFDDEIVIDSLRSYGKENIKLFSNGYNNVALELIKAWDEFNDIKYLEIASKIIDLIQEFMDEEIITINKAQIEYRKNKAVTPKTLEKLYRIKFSTNEKFYLAGINILVGSIEEFEDVFNKFDNDNRKRFMEFPIYKLYLNLKEE